MQVTILHNYNQKQIDECYYLMHEIGCYYLLIIWKKILVDVNYHNTMAAGNCVRSR